MSHRDLRQRANRVRDIPLESVLLVRGAVRDRHDRAKWHTEQGPVSITEAKFTSWQGKTGKKAGGGGAIDLVMHLAGLECDAAVAWLERHLAVGEATAVGELARVPSAPARPSSSVGTAAAGGGAPAATCKGARRLRMPMADARRLGGVRKYLTDRRHLSGALVEQLVASGKLYADGRGNAVFVMVRGKPNRPVGAELRGTGARVWRGHATGTRKDLGYFWIGAAGSSEIVLCESAIDAISCFQVEPRRICISTAGVRANPEWLRGLIARGYVIHCGFDTDAAGEWGAERMLALHGGVRRLRPPAHDWNDALASAR